MPRLNSSGYSSKRFFVCACILTLVLLAKLPESTTVILCRRGY